MRKIEISYYQGKTLIDMAKKFFSNPEVQADFERWKVDGRRDALMKEIEKYGIEVIGDNYFPLDAVTHNRKKITI